MLFINNIKIAIRNAMRNRLFSLINISGLALGLACCLVIVLYVTQELSYDKYHKNAKDIYRVGVEANINDNYWKVPSTQSPLGKTLKSEYPEVEEFMRLANYQEQMIKVEERSHVVNKIYAVDSTFFSFFNNTFLAGNKNALAKNNSVILSRTTAVKFFKTVENAIGKTISLRDQSFNVEAIVEDCPNNTHLKYNMLFSLSKSEWAMTDNWSSDGMQTYIKLKPNSDYKSLEKRLAAVVEKRILPAFTKHLNIDLSAPNYYRYYLMPMTDIHLKAHSIIEYEENGNRTYVNMFIIIAIFILLIACVNFSNLSTAKASTRAKEIGVKKSLGSGKNRLRTQFFTESILISIIAFIISVVIVETCLPFINNIIGIELLSTFNSNFTVLGLFVGIAIITGLIAGSYSAIYLSSFNPVKILKGELTIGKKSAKFRGALVIFQFAISIFLIICTLIINKQFNYIQNKDLGFHKENFIKVENADIIKNHDVFTQKLKELSGVKNVTFTSHLPGKFCRGNMIEKYNSEDKNSYNVRLLQCDENYLNTMGCEMIQGRFFSSSFASDSMAVILNETAVTQLGLQKPLETILKFPGRDYKFNVIGVVKDFHSVSLKSKVQPFVLIHQKKWYQNMNYMGIRIDDNSKALTIKQIEAVWSEFTDGAPLKFSYLDDVVTQLHINEKSSLKIFSAFSFLAIFIACIGLLGLVSFTIDQKVKEIGIRKILGSPVSAIVIRLNMDIIKWISISFVIACPCAYILMNSWLQDFIYRINIGTWVFILSGLTTLLITLTAVSWQALRAARMNPVDCLRSE